MLKTLYFKGYLDYKSLILDNYKELDIKELDAIILIKILELYKVNKKIRVSKVSQETGINKRVVEECLETLISKNIYSLDIVENANGLNDEVVNLDPLFDKIDLIFKKEENVKIEEDLSKVIKEYEEAVMRPLTAQEYGVFSSWMMDDKFKDTEIIYAIKKASDSKRVNLSYIEKLIIQSRESELRPKMDKDKAKKLSEIMDMIK